MIDWVKVLSPTRHKIGHFGDVLPSQSEKRKQTQQKQTCIRNKIHYDIKLTQKLKPGWVASYELRHGDGKGLFWKE